MSEESERRDDAPPEPGDERMEMNDPDRLREGVPNPTQEHIDEEGGGTQPVDADWEDQPPTT